MSAATGEMIADDRFAYLAAELVRREPAYSARAAVAVRLREHMPLVERLPAGGTRELGELLDERPTLDLLILDSLQAFGQGQRDLAATLRCKADGLRREDHPADAGVDGELGKGPADVGQDVLVVDGADLVERLVAVLDHAVLGRLDEGEVGHLAEAEGGHLEDLG